MLVGGRVSLHEDIPNWCERVQQHVFSIGRLKRKAGIQNIQPAFLRRFFFSLFHRWRGAKIDHVLELRQIKRSFHRTQHRPTNKHENKRQTYAGIHGQHHSNSSRKQHSKVGLLATQSALRRFSNRTASRRASPRAIDHGARSHL